MLHEISFRCAQAWSLLYWITQSNLPPTRYIDWTRTRIWTEPNLVISIRNLQQQSPLFTNCDTFHRPTKGYDSLCQARVPPGVEPGPLASDANALPHSHLLGSHNCSIRRRLTLSQLDTVSRLLLQIDQTEANPIGQHQRSKCDQQNFTIMEIYHS